MHIGIIVLAAGSSSRMGRSKQLLEIDGKPLLCRCVEHALATKASQVVVVLGANEKPHRKVIEELPVDIVTNSYWKTGMGGSIKTGLNYLIQSGKELDAVILMVCDQPALTSDHLLRLIEKLEEKKKAIIASSYSDSSGVPVLFSRSFFSNLLLLDDSQGAKKILQQFPDQVEAVEFPNGSIDLDTENDYENYLKGQ
jgi:molybdenum cofactor cytidylyltransferase